MDSVQLGLMIVPPSWLVCQLLSPLINWLSENLETCRSGWRHQSSCSVHKPETFSFPSPTRETRKYSHFETFRAHISSFRTNVCGIKLKCHLEILKILTYSSAPTKDYEGKGYFIKSINLLIVFFIKLSVDKEISESFASQSLIAKLSSVQTENVFLQH